MKKAPHTTQPRAAGKFDKSSASGGQMDARAYPKQQHAISVKSSPPKYPKK